MLESSCTASFFQKHFPALEGSGSKYKRIAPLIFLSLHMFDAVYFVLNYLVVFNCAREFSYRESNSYSRHYCQLIFGDAFFKTSHANSEQTYVQTMAPEKTPVVVGQLLDLDCSEDFVRQLLSSVGRGFPVDELVDQVKKCCPFVCSYVGIGNFRNDVSSWRQPREVAPSCRGRGVCRTFPPPSPRGCHRFTRLFFLVLHMTPVVKNSQQKKL